ncbi:hypothetical protein JYT28_00600 [Desulfobulbus sp. AH-315-M07]|nr:hypothetical protein [Desulfobulbus sp. AH-315-M07]
MSIILQLRDLKNGSPSQKEFATEAEAIAYLKDRPKLVAVIGVADAGLDKDINDRLKAANRPLDVEEQLAERELQASLDKDAEDRAKAQRAREAEEVAKQQKEQQSADPNRKMAVRYHYDKGLSVAEPYDTREIPDVAREIVEAFVAERTTWVKDRNQMVGEARVELWPADLPEGVTERMISGTFVPVAALRDDE